MVRRGLLAEGTVLNPSKDSQRSTPQVMHAWRATHCPWDLWRFVLVFVFLSRDGNSPQ